MWRGSETIPGPKEFYCVVLKTVHALTTDWNNSTYSFKEFVIYMRNKWIIIQTQWFTCDERFIFSNIHITITETFVLFGCENY